MTFYYFYSPHYYTHTHVRTYKVWSPSITTNNGSNYNDGNNVPSINTLLPQQPNDILKFITEASKAAQIKWRNKHHGDPVRFHSPNYLIKIRICLIYIYKETEH